MSNMHLQIVTPKRIVYDGECKFLEYVTTEGAVGIYPGHMAMTQVLAPGRFSIYEEGKDKQVVGVIHSGISKIMPDSVMLLTEVCELKEEIDIERAKVALARSEKRLQERLDRDFDYERALKSYNRAKARIEVGTE